MPLILFDLFLVATVLYEHLMDKSFDPVQFVSRMTSGAFDGRLHEELARLSQEQLEQVAALLAVQAGQPVRVTSE